MINFGLALKVRRQRYGLSQSELARKAGITPAAISIIEKGQRNPTLDVAYRITEALGISLDRFIKGESDPSIESTSRWGVFVRFADELLKLSDKDLVLVENIIKRLNTG